MFLKVLNITRQKTLAARVRAARSFADRTKGLLGTKGLKTDEGLWLSPCRAVHMLGMRYSIDVLWVSAEGKVLHTATMKPWQFSRWIHEAAGVLELAQGRLQATGTRVGDQLRMEEKN